jgi:hypothetical protein
MSVLTIASYIGVLVRTLMMWTLGNAALCAASNHVAVSRDELASPIKKIRSHGTVARVSVGPK